MKGRVKKGRSFESKSKEFTWLKINCLTKIKTKENCENSIERTQRRLKPIWEEKSGWEKWRAKFWKALKKFINLQIIVNNYKILINWSKS